VRGYAANRFAAAKRLAPSPEKRNPLTPSLRADPLPLGEGKRAQPSPGGRGWRRSRRVRGSAANRFAAAKRLAPSPEKRKPLTPSLRADPLPAGEGCRRAS
jgi:hypothetical protein